MVPEVCSGILKSGGKNELLKQHDNCSVIVSWDSDVVELKYSYLVGVKISIQLYHNLSEI